MAGHRVGPGRKASQADADAAIPQAQKAAATAGDSDHDSNGDNKTSTKLLTSSLSPGTKSNSTRNSSPDRKHSFELHEPYTPHCDALLSISEMRELIFLNLDEHDILRCKRVSHTFKNTIHSSIKLRRRLFLAPDNSISPLYLNSMVLRATREGDFKYDIHRKRDSVNRSHLNDSISRYIALDHHTDLGPIAEMFITQPPVDKIIFHAQYFKIRNTEYRYRDCWEVVSSDGGGVKVKDIVMEGRKMLAKEAEKFAREEGKGLQGGGYGEGMRLHSAMVEGRGLVREWAPRQGG
ncbi:hypothetical protein TI39_contig4111g00013 [Zymoseptoria brevis]|uniref:F-box domain-containing protein n=1 Tax=Zymoseptoria brevis TaxID=1047168 RepID=A0A0F4GDU3_9PEZI|nr:hypothetical protein TI39_contig4111g00013 [Zymoseptoria brevis]